MKKLIMAVACMLVFFVQPAFAEVITSEQTEGYADYLYVAGSPDEFPLEYYDEEAEEYKGIMPDFLKEISEPFFIWWFLAGRRKGTYPTTADSHTTIGCSLLCL